MPWQGNIPEKLATGYTAATAAVASGARWVGLKETKRPEATHQAKLVNRQQLVSHFHHFDSSVFIRASHLFALLEKTNVSHKNGGLLPRFPLTSFHNIFPNFSLRCIFVC